MATRTTGTACNDQRKGGQLIIEKEALQRGQVEDNEWNTTEGAKRISFIRNACCEAYFIVLFISLAREYLQTSDPSLYGCYFARDGCVLYSTNCYRSKKTDIKNIY